MATTRITPDEDAVVCEVHIGAPPERVFEAIIDPKQVLQWWSSPDCQIEAFSFEPRKGGRWSYDTKQSSMNVNGVSKFHCEGEVLEYDPPRTLAYSWIANWHEDKSQRTVVRWELTPRDGGTDVKLTHSGLVNLAMSRKDYSGGWIGVANTLKKFVETH